MITIKENIDIINEISKYDILLVGTSIYNRLTNGWQLDAKLAYPIIHKENIETRYGDKDKLGKYITVNVNEKQQVCVLYITESNNFRPDLNKDYLSYEALENCLYRINIEFKGKRIGCPLLGSSKFDGNGDNEKVLSIFKGTLTDVDCVIYDYDQTSAEYRSECRIKAIMDAKTQGKTSGDKTLYYQLIAEKKAYMAKLKAINNLTYFK